MMMRKKIKGLIAFTSMLKILLHLIVFLILTIITQIGGIVYLVAVLSFSPKKEFFRVKRLGVFLAVYIIATLLIVPLLAPLFGREKVKNSELIEAHTYFTVLLNRNYVQPELNKALFEIAHRLNPRQNGIKLVYLDANFPFINKFPLLPHLSHKDGKKIDISLVYQTKDGKLTNKKPSVSGYGVFAGPQNTEYDQIAECSKLGYNQYSFTKYLTFGKINRDIEFSAKGTKILLKAILQQPEIGKIYIEPHLKSRLKISGNKIRFHGCKAVRHDDHIHFQLK